MRCECPGSVPATKPVARAAPARGMRTQGASAIGQTATCEIQVQPANVQVEIHLPWLLAAMAGKVEKLLQSNATDTLRIGTTKKV